MTPEEKNDLCEKAFKSIYPSCGCKDTDLLESLKDILGNDRAERIKNVNRYNKPVLFISNNISLIRGAVSYLWYTQGQDMPPHVLSCSGLREEEVLAKLNGDWIETAFKNIEFCTYLCGVLFFEDSNPYENILRQLWAKVEDNKDPGILVISMGNIGNLSQGLLDRFEVIELDAEKQDKTVDILQAKTKSEDSNIKNKTLFFDDNTNYLWFSEDKKTRIEGEDAKLVKAMLDMTKKENRHCCRKEEIILKAYGITVEINKKIPQKIANKLNTSKSTINKKCKLGLNIKELIQRDGVKLLKYSINVERRKL